MHCQRAHIYPPAPAVLQGHTAVEPRTYLLSQVCDLLFFLITCQVFNCFADLLSIGQLVCFWNWLTGPQPPTKSAPTPGECDIFEVPGNPLKIDAKTVPPKCPKWSPKGTSKESPNRQNVVPEPSQNTHPKKHQQMMPTVSKQVTFLKAPTCLNHSKY